MITEEVYFGGAAYRTLTGDIKIEPGEARVWTINPNGVSIRTVSLPNATTLKVGGPIFYIWNNSGADTFNIDDFATGLVVQAATNRIYKFVLLDNTTTAGTWAYSSIRVGSSLAVTMAQVDGYVHGGTGGTGKTSMYFYDITANTWTVMAGSATSREFGAGFGFSRIGFYIGDFPASGGVSDTLDGYSVLLDTWTNYATATYEPGKNVAAAIKGKGYCITGKDVVDNIEFDPKLNTWATQNSIGFNRYQAAADPLNDRIYIYSGLPADNKNIYYHPGSDSYIDFTKYTLVDRYDIASFEIDSKLVIVGGRDGTFFYDDVEEYNPSTDTWTTKTVLGLGDRYQGVGITGRDKSYYGAGLNSSAVSQTGTQSYDISDTWTTVTPMSSVKEAIANMAVSLV